MTRPKKKRKPSRREALAQLQRVDDKLNRFRELKFSEFVQLRNEMRFIIENFPELETSPDVQEIFNTIDAVIKWYQLMNVEVNKFEDFLVKAGTQMDREVQLTEPVKHLCARCGRRERRIDEYCKRCADELGIRPKGKI